MRQSGEGVREGKGGGGKKIEREREVKGPVSPLQGHPTWGLDPENEDLCRALCGRVGKVKERERWGFPCPRSKATPLGGLTLETKTSVAGSAAERRRREKESREGKRKIKRKRERWGGLLSPLQGHPTGGLTLKTKTSAAGYAAEWKQERRQRKNGKEVPICWVCLSGQI